MADILKHPDADYNGDDIFPFHDGKSIIIRGGKNRSLTVSESVYMLECVKYQLLRSVHKNSE